MGNDSRVWVLEGPRERLVDILDGSWSAAKQARAVRSRDAVIPTREKLSFVWTAPPNQEAELPHLIVGEDDALTDLLSWSATFVRAIGPLSAHSRLFTPDEMDALFSRSGQEQKLTGLDKACVGLIYGEVSAQARRVIPAADLSLAACHSTLSFSLIKAIYANIKEEKLKAVPDLWLRARQILDQRSPTADWKTPLRAVHLLMALSEKTSWYSDPYLEALIQFRESGSAQLIGADLISLGMLYEVGGVEGLMTLPAEDRVRVFDRVVESILSSNLQPEDITFAIAQIAVMCRPGALEAINLVSPYINQYPQVALWYGFMQGLVPRNDSLATGEGLGWRVARDLQQIDDVRYRPRCDIALRELEIFSRSRSGYRPVRTELRSRALVELRPGLTVAFKMTERDRPVYEQAALPLPEGRSSDTHEKINQPDSEFGTAGDELVEIEAALNKSLSLVRRARRRSSNDKLLFGKKRRQQRDYDY